MNVRVKLFAAARERGGRDAVELELPARATAGDLRAALGEEFPELASLLPSSLIAVDHQYASDDSEIPAGGEVALIPPVSGG